MTHFSSGILTKRCSSFETTPDLHYPVGLDGLRNDECSEPVTTNGEEPGPAREGNSLVWGSRDQALCGWKLKLECQSLKQFQPSARGRGLGCHIGSHVNGLLPGQQTAGQRAGPREGALEELSVDSG